MQGPVTVYVWVSLLKANSPGHAALSMGPAAATPQSGYLSFAPRVAGSAHGPGHFYSRAHDVEHYAKRGVWIGTIYGLDVDSMMRSFHQERMTPPTYSLLNECSTVVHRYLAIGGGDKLASQWSRTLLVNVWSPDDVEDYARSIVNATATLGSQGIQRRGEGTIF